MSFQFTHSAKVFSPAFLFLFLVLAPEIVFGKGLVPCGGDGEPACDFNQLIQLVQNIITFAIIIAAPLAAIMFSYAGFLYLTAAGDTGQVGKAHGIFMTVFWGIVIVLAAWLIVNTILEALTGSKSSSLLGNQQNSAFNQFVVPGNSSASQPSQRIFGPEDYVPPIEGRVIPQISPEEFVP